MLLSFSESVAFAGKALVRRDFFSYSLVFDMDIEPFLFSNPKNFYFIEDSQWNKHSRLANQSQIISYSSTTF